MTARIWPNQRPSRAGVFARPLAMQYAVDVLPANSFNAASDDEPRGTKAILVGSNTWGAQGAWHLDAARSEVGRALSRAVSGRFFHVSNLFSPSDEDAFAGKISDSSTGRPVQDALITVTGLDKSSLAVGRMTGALLSWSLPLENGGIELSVTAPGSETQYSSIAAGSPDTVRIVNLVLVENLPQHQLRLRGIINDARTSKPIKAHIVVPEAVNVDTAQTVTFDIAFKPGNHKTLVSARGYVIQKRRLSGEEGDVASP